MEEDGQEKMEPSCCIMSGLRCIVTKISNRMRKRLSKQPPRNDHLASVRNRLRRRLKERQAPDAAESVSESQKATKKVTETNQATDTPEDTHAQVTGAEPLMTSKWVIIQRRKGLEAAKRPASETSLHETQTEEATETIETPKGVTKTIEVPKAFGDIEGQEVMASDLPKMTEEAAPQETRSCWGDIPSTLLEDAEPIDNAEGEQGLIPDDDMDSGSVSSFGSNCSELERILNMEACDLDSLSSSLKHIDMERQFNMYDEPDTMSINSSCSNLSGLDGLFQSRDDLDTLSIDSSCSNLSGLDRLFQSQDDLDTLSNATSFSNLGLEDLFEMEVEVQELNMKNQDEWSPKQDVSNRITFCRALAMFSLCAGAVWLGFTQAYMLGF
ncbi:uncharacterized protein LOC134466232 isoform X2 [Engraulis encrasicolus]|uniref:uncharacterized protein LOC134466232 isoform X2 n=1 Tax=Engraulis encrasicolus TaxID=184585 RepID=UPI002FD6D090